MVVPTLHHWLRSISVLIPGWLCFVFLLPARTPPATAASVLRHGRVPSVRLALRLVSTTRKREIFLGQNLNYL